MQDSHDEHGREKTHAHKHDAETKAETVTGIEKLKKMTEYWISHNEEHARSYRLWAGRAREVGYGEPGDILEQIASEVVEINERLRKVIQIIDSGGQP
ncbi:MAG: hypothetical protein ABSE08_04025 [Syntrophobacteraceae bacterium]|jgi:hypothetical protein